MPRLQGFIPHVENQQAHVRFINACEPDVVLLSLLRGRYLKSNGETCASFFGDDVDVVMTSTINDEDLAKMGWKQEFEIIEAVKPDYHIPTDYPVYYDMAEEVRVTLVKQCMEGTIWMANQLEDAGVGTEIIPLIKGLSPGERAICYRAYQTLQPEQTAYYATQFFSGGAGNNVTRLRENVQAIVDEDAPEMLMLGLGSPQYLKTIPTDVIAGTGLNQWLQATGLRDKQQTEEYMQSGYDSLTERVEAALAYNPADMAEEL